MYFHHIQNFYPIGELRTDSVEVDEKIDNDVNHQLS